MAMSIDRTLRMARALLSYAVEDHGIAALVAEFAKPEHDNLRLLLLQLVGDETAPDVPAPTSQLRPFSTRGNQFLHNGQPFMFIGYNLRELPWYSDQRSDFTKHADWGFALHQLRIAKEVLFGKVVRIYAAFEHDTVEQAIPKVLNALDAIAARGLYAIVALTDGVHSGFSIPDRPENFFGRHTHRFYAGGYEEKYLPYIRTMVKAIADHPALCIIEIANECLIPFPPYVPNNPTTRQYENVLKFFRVASDTIREHAPHNIIGTGLISAWELFADQAYEGKEYAKQLYAMPNINAASVHSYEGERNEHRWGATGMHLAKEMELQGHPIYIGETGMIFGTQDGGFTARLGAETAPRVSGLLQWALQAWHEPRAGGDAKVGMNQFQSTMWHFYSGNMRHLAQNVYR